MSFKRSAHFALFLSAVAILFGSVGCSYFLKEKPKPKNAIVIATAEGNRDCLGRTLEIMGEYFGGKGQIAETDKIIGCAETSIDLFTKHVRGKSSPNAFTQEELKRFVETNFLKGRALDPELVPLLFRLKSSLFGGSADLISRDEMQKIKALISSFKTYARQLEPFADIYGFNAPPVTRSEVELKRFEKASETFVATVESITGHFKGERRPDFAIKDFDRLLEISGKMGDSKRFVELAGAIKQILVRPPAETIGANDWKLLATSGARLYTFYLRYHYYLKGSSILWGPDLPHLEKVVRQTLDLMDRSVEHRPGGKIVPEEWNLLLDKLETGKLLPFGLRKESLKAMIWPLSGRVLRDPSRPQPKRTSPSGMGAAELRQLRADVENWLAGHHLAIGFSSDEKLFSDKEIRNSFSKLPPASMASVTSEALRSAKAELSDLLSRGRLLAWDDEGRLQIVRREEAKGLRRKDVILLNAVRGVVRAVLRGYAADARRSSSIGGITEGEMQEFYLDVREFGIDLGLMDPRVFTAGKRSFMEANLFTSAGNGDDWISLHEGVEFFEYVFSGGALSEKIYKATAKICPSAELDFVGKTKLNAVCLRDHLKTNFETYFSNLPGMVDYVRRIRGDNAKWDEFVTALEHATRHGGHSDNSFEVGELKTIAPVLHYAESLFVNFDDDRSGILEKNEIWAGFPRFRNFIRKLGNGQAETNAIQETVFSYMIVHGRPPSPGKKGMAEVGIWLPARKLWNAKADRLDSLKIISSIALQSRQARFTQIEAFLKSSGPDLAQTLAAGDDKTVSSLRDMFLCPSTADRRLKQLMIEQAPIWSKNVSPEERRKFYCTEDKECEQASDEMPVTDLVFASRVNAAIKSDRILSNVCLPIF